MTKKIQTFNDVYNRFKNNGNIIIRECDKPLYELFFDFGKLAGGKEEGERLLKLIGRKHEKIYN